MKLAELDNIVGIATVSFTDDTSGRLLPVWKDLGSIWAKIQPFKDIVKIFCRDFPKATQIDAISMNGEYFLLESIKYIASDWLELVVKRQNYG